jgi:hypothetical protein
LRKRRVFRNMLRMPTRRIPQKPAPKTARDRMREHRARLRAQGLRPIQLWVPDLRKPEVREAIRREVKQLHKHPENAVIDDWIEAAIDPSDWR